MGIAEWAVATVFILAISYLIHRSLRTDVFDLNALIYLFLCMFLTTLMLMIFGLLGALRADWIALTSLLGLLLLIALPRTRVTLLEGWRSVFRLPAAFMLWWRALPLWLRWVAGPTFIFYALRLLFLTWALPPFTWDSLTYHLTNVAHWVQSGRIEVFETPVTRIFSPANYEVFATWFTLFLHHDAFIEVSGIPSYLMMLLGVYAVGRRIGLSEAGSLLAVLGYASTPAVLFVATGTKNDPQVVGLFFMALAIILDIAARPGECEARNLLGQMVLLAMVLLFALGTKTYIVHISVGLLAIAIWASMVNRRIGLWLRVPGDFIRSLRKAGWGRTLLLTTLLAVALFMGAYWYVRNWGMTGNPFYPYGVLVGNQQMLDTDFGTARVGWGNLEENLRGLVRKFGDKHYRMVPDLPSITGWGWIAYVLGLPTLVWGLLRRRGIRMLTMGFLLALMALFYTSTTSPYNMRYAIWFSALMALALGAFYDWLPSALRKIRLTFLVMFLICLGLNTVVTMTYNLVPIEVIVRMMELPMGQREAARMSFRVPEEYENALTFVPREDLLGYNVHANGFLYPLFRSDYSQRLVYVPFDEEDTCEEIAAAMKERGTRWLFVAPEHTNDLKIAKLRECSDTESPIRERSRGVYVLRP